MEFFHLHEWPTWIKMGGNLKIRVKKIIFCLSLFVVSHLHAAEWLTDLPTALAKAKAEGKSVLMDFTGSDWCPWCIRLRKEIFDQTAFQKFADENLILVELDFP